MPPSLSPTFVRRCPRCLKSQLRPFHRSVSSEQPSKPPTPRIYKYAPLPTRRLISLHGRDAPQFLQGLTTANISTPTHRNGLYSAFLNASGRVLYDVFICPANELRPYGEAILGNAPEEPWFLIEVDANEVESLAKHLKRFRLRAKVGIQIMDEEEWGVWSLWPKVSVAVMDKTNFWYFDERAPNMGCRSLRPRSKPPEDNDYEEEVTPEQYKVARMMKGVAEGQSEIIKESALPQESNIDYMGGIDFRKGCYVGQELTIRTHHTGVVRKRILPVQLYNSASPDTLTYDPTSKLALPPSGANISRVDKKGRSAGKWLGGVGNIGLALCRLEVMTDTVLTAEGSSWSPEQEFKVAWEPEGVEQGGEVKIKAFVPDWHKERAKVQGLHRGDGEK